MKNTIFYLLAFVSIIALGGFVFTNSKAENIDVEIHPAEAKWVVKNKGDKMVMGQPVEELDFSPIKRAVFLNRIRTGSLPVKFLIEAENEGAEKNEELSCKIELNGVGFDGNLSVVDRDGKCFRGMVSVDLASMTNLYKEEQILEFLNAFFSDNDFSVTLN